MRKVNVNVGAVEDELVGAETGVCSVSAHEEEQQAHISRRHLYVARNGDAQFADLNEAAEIETTPLSTRSLFAYDSGSGKLYLAESNQSANLEAVGWSQVLAGGMYTCVCSPYETRELAFVLNGIGAPGVEPGRGLFVCEDTDDMKKVECLLKVILQGGHQHPEDILFCMSQVPNLRGMGASALVLR